MGTGYINCLADRLVT